MISRHQRFFSRAAMGLLPIIGSTCTSTSRASAQPAQKNPTPSLSVPLTLLHSIKLSDPPAAFAFALDNKKIAFASNGGAVRLWNVETGELKLVWSANKPKGKQPKSKPSSEFETWLEQTGGNWHDSILALSPDGKKFALAGVDAVIHLYDLQSGQEKLLKGDLARLSNQSYRIITTLGFSNDGHTLIAAGEALELWDLRTGQSHLLREMQDLSTNVALSPDGTSIAVTDVPFSLTGTPRDPYVELRDSHTGKVRWTHTSPSMHTMASELVFSRGGKMLAAVGDSTTLWDTRTGTEKGNIPVAAHALQSFNGAVASDGTTISVVLDQTPTPRNQAPRDQVPTGQIALYDATTRKPSWMTPKLDGQPQVLGFNGDNTLLIGSDSALPGDAGSGDPGGVFGGSAVVRVWNAKNGKLLKTLADQTGLALSPDGTLLLTRDWKNNSYRVWRLGSPPATLNQNLQ